MGWMFDGAEMGVFSLVGRPALHDVLHSSNEGEVGFWFGIVTALFLVGAATGGVFFGWLGDRFGRVCAMSLSVLVYAMFTGACAFAQSALQIALLRFIASLGMGGEWSLGVALVMELWPNRSRALLAGFIGAAANFGYLLVAIIGLGLTSFIGNIAKLLTTIGVSSSWVEFLTNNQGWRLLMLFGVTPAALTLFIRMFVPESRKWEQEKERGTISHWAATDLFGVGIGLVSALGIILLWVVRDVSLTVRIAGTLVGLAVCTCGYLYPAIRYLQRLTATHRETAPSLHLLINRMIVGAALSGVTLLGTWASLQWAPTWVDHLTNSQMPAAKSWTQICASIGAIFGTISAAILGDLIGRRATYRIMCISSFVSILLLYGANDSYGPMLLGSVFVAGAATATFYGWLPLYLPELFGTSVREQHKASRSISVGFWQRLGRYKQET